MIQATMTEAALTRTAELKVTGHALNAPYGHDIVCAAVSTICGMVGNYSYDGIVHDDGDVFQVIANMADEGNYRLWRAATGTLQQLAQQYPDNVTFNHVMSHG